MDGAGSTPTGNASPWTASLYIAVGSAVYLCVLLYYLTQLIRSRKRLMTSEPFPFNNATISLLASATKIPSDVTETPPGVLDHLLRLTGIFLFCITINLSLSALGRMRGFSIISNMLGFAVYLVVELFNLSFGRGSLATPFLFEQRLFSAVMCFLFALMVSHSLTVPTARRQIENKFQFYNQWSLKKWEKEPKKQGKSFFSFDRLKKYHKRYWVMAVTSNPDWALRAWGTPLVCSILTWGVVGVGLAVRIALLLRRAWGDGEWTVFVRSSYQRLAAVVFLLHIISIAVAGWASVFQSLNFNPALARLREKLEDHTPLGRKDIVEVLSGVEDYRMELLTDWREAPLPLKSKLSRKAISGARVFLLDSLTNLQLGVIFAGNFLLTISALAVFGLHHRSRPGSGDSAETKKLIEDYDARLRRANYEKRNTSWLALHEGWIEKDSTMKAATLLEFLKSYSVDQKKRTQRWLYRPKVDRLIEDNEPYPPHSWTLTILVLAYIVDRNFQAAESKSRNVKDAIGKMKEAVRQFIRLSRLVDMNFSPSEGSDRMRAAVEKVKQKLDLEPSGFWDLVLDSKDEVFEGSLFLAEEGFNANAFMVQHIYKCQSGTPAEIDEEQGGEDQEVPTEKLMGRTRKQVDDLLKKSRSDRSWKLFMLNCMYRVAAGLNECPLRRKGKVPANAVENTLKIFLQLLADAMVACLSRLPLALIRHCSNGDFGRKEERVREATLALCEAEGILKLMEKNVGKDRHLLRSFDFYEKDWNNLGKEDE